MSLPSAPPPHIVRVFGAVEREMDLHPRDRMNGYFYTPSHLYLCTYALSLCLIRSEIFPLDVSPNCNRT